MTFAAQETSRDKGEPIGLLLFSYATGDNIAYTDSEVPVTYGGNTFLPIPNDRDSVKVSGTLDKAQVLVTLPQDCSLSKKFDVFPQSDVVSLVIYEAHVDNSDVKVMWIGRVIGVKNEGSGAIFTCEPFATSVRRMGLRRRYGYGCPHVLYGDQCNASEVAATVTSTVSSVAGAVITLPTGWNGANPQAKYIAGMAKWTTDDGRLEIRTIINYSGANTVQLSGYANDLPSSLAISMVLGCSHQRGDCETLHSNINNFGGQPWIPTFNPIGITNNFF